MYYVLFFQLCTFLSGPNPASCSFTKIPKPNLAECEERAKFFNEKFQVKRTYKGEVVKNDIAMTTPATCVLKKDL